jgi:hypothetical protein
MTVYDTPNSQTTHTIPNYAQRVTLIARGAQGDPGDDSPDFFDATGGSGGPGGEGRGELDVSGGETFDILVAGVPNSPHYAGGAPGTDGETISDGDEVGNDGGPGGGSSAIQRNGTDLVIGDGGGGGGAGDPTGSTSVGGGGGGGARGGAAGENAAEAGSGSGNGGAGGDGDEAAGPGGDGSPGGGYYNSSALATGSTATGVRSASSGYCEIVVHVVPFGGLTASETADGSVSLSWDNTEGENGFEIHRSTTSGFAPDASTQIGSVGADVTSYTDANVSQGTQYYYKVVGYNSVSTAASNEAGLLTSAPAPTLDSVSVVNGDQLDVQWTRNGADETDYRVLLSYDGNAYQQANGDLSPSTTQYTTAEQLDGEGYTVEVQAVYPDPTSASRTQTATTALLDEDQPALGNGVEDEIAVDRETAPTDNGHVRWQVRETGQSSWDSSAIGYDEGTVSYDTVTFPITGREDGEQYEVRLRTETPDVVGSWTAPVAITTRFPTPADLSASADSPTQVTLTWTDQADNEDGFVVERRRLWPDGPGPWAELADLDPNTEQYVDDTVQPDAEYEYRLTAYTEHVEATETATVATPALAGTTSAPVASSGYTVEIERSDGAIRRPSPLDGVTEQPRLNGRPGIEIPLRPDLSWLDASWEGADLRVWRDGVRLPIDEVASIEPQPSQTTLRGQGGAALRTRHEQDVTDQSAHDTCRDILDSTGLSYTVDPAPTDANVEIVTIDTQEELADALDADATAPVQVSNGGVEPLQTAFVTSAADISTAKLVGSASYNWTVSEAVELSVANTETEAWQIDVPYPIPSEHVGLAVRKADDFLGAVFLSIDGQEVGEFASNARDGETSVYWTAFDASAAPSLSGTHEVAVTTGSGGYTNGPSGVVYIDCAVVFDQRYHDASEFVNTLNDSNLLDGPPGPYAAVDADFLSEAALDRVTGGRLDATLSSTANEQAIGIRPSDATLAFTTNSNSASVETDFSDDYSRLDARVTLAATNGDVGNDVTVHRTQPQRLDALTITADVLRSVTISDRSLDNRAETLLSQITDQADLIWEVQWRNGGQYVVVTRPGQRQSDADPDLVDWSVSKDVNRQLTQVAIYGSSQRVEGESFVADINEVSLDFDRIQQDSERVYEEHSDGSVTVYERGADADYVMEYLLGNIRIVAGSDMVDGQQYQIDYSEQALGEVFAGGGVSADYPLVEEIPALHTDLQCQRAAEILLRQGNGPIWSATVTIADDVGFALTESIDPSRVPTPPGGAGLRVESVDNQPGQVRLELGVGQSLDALVSTLQNKLSETARQT